LAYALKQALADWQAAVPGMGADGFMMTIISADTNPPRSA